LPRIVELVTADRIALIDDGLKLEIWRRCRGSRESQNTG
jgi:hypothetical protein